MSFHASVETKHFSKGNSLLRLADPKTASKTCDSAIGSGGGGGGGGVGVYSHKGLTGESSLFEGLSKWLPNGPFSITIELLSLACDLL